MKTNLKLLMLVVVVLGCFFNAKHFGFEVRNLESLMSEQESKNYIENIILLETLYTNYVAVNHSLPNSVDDLFDSEVKIINFEDIENPFTGAPLQVTENCLNAGDISFEIVNHFHRLKIFAPIEEDDEYELYIEVLMSDENDNQNYFRDFNNTLSKIPQVELTGDLIRRFTKDYIRENRDSVTADEIISCSRYIPKLLNFYTGEYIQWGVPSEGNIVIDFEMNNARSSNGEEHEHRSVHLSYYYLDEAGELTYIIFVL